MKESYTAVVARNDDWTLDWATEPHTCSDQDLADDASRFGIGWVAHHRAIVGGHRGAVAATGHRHGEAGCGRCEIGRAERHDVA